MAAQSAEQTVDVGTLVGWSYERRGNRIILKVQTVNKPPPHRRGDVQEFFLLMDSNQAVQLGHSMFEITNQTKPNFDRRRNPLLRWLLGA